MNELLELGRKLVPRKTIVDKPADILFAEKCEGNFASESTRLQVKLQRQEWMCRHLKLSRTVSRDREQTARPQASEHVAQHVNSRRVRPVNVFNEKNEGLA